MKVWGGLRETSELWWDLLGLVAAGRKPLQPEPGGDMRSSCWHMEGVCSCRRWLPDRSCSCWWRTATTANAVGKERGAKYPNIFLFLTLNPLPGMAIGQNRQEPEGKEAQLIDSIEVSVAGHRAGWRVDLEGQVRQPTTPSQPGNEPYTLRAFYCLLLPLLFCTLKLGWVKKKKKKGKSLEMAVKP